jgi:hypothetical protein
MTDLSTINWRAIVSERWKGATIHGDGPCACVVRFCTPTAVHLFQTHIEAETFRAAFCNARFCEHKHNVGSLIQFVPAPPVPFRRGWRNRGLYERE